MSPSDYEMIEQGYDPPRMTHPLERVEEIVARCETYQYSLPRDEQRALIASWRERGEQLALMPKQFQDYIERAEDDERTRVEAMRAKTLDECETLARTAVQSSISGERYVANKIAGAIAALKDKP